MGEEKNNRGRRTRLTWLLATLFISADTSSNSESEPCTAADKHNTVTSYHTARLAGAPTFLLIQRKDYVTLRDPLWSEKQTHSLLSPHTHTASIDTDTFTCAHRPCAPAGADDAPPTWPLLPVFPRPGLLSSVALILLAMLGLSTTFLRAQAGSWLTLRRNTASSSGHGTTHKLVIPVGLKGKPVILLLLTSTGTIYLSIHASYVYMA